MVLISLFSHKYSYPIDANFPPLHSSFKATKDSHSLLYDVPRKEPFYERITASSYFEGRCKIVVIAGFAFRDPYVDSLGVSHGGILEAGNIVFART